MDGRSPVAKVTVTPGRTAPDSSRTVPITLPVMTCACAAPATAITARTTRAALLLMRTSTFDEWTAGSGSVCEYHGIQLDAVGKNTRPLAKVNENRSEWSL